MALLVNDPEIGIDPKKEPARFDKPRAIISWVASTPFPFSANGIEKVAFRIESWFSF